MRKFYILFLVMAILLGTLCSCGKVNEEMSSDVTGAASITVSDESTLETTKSEESSISEETTPETIKSEESDVSDVIPSETSSDTVESTSSEITNGAESATSKEAPSATSSEQSPVYKSIDEVPKIVLDGDPVPYKVLGGTDYNYEYNIKFDRIVRTREELLAFCEEYNFESYEHSLSLFKDVKNKYDDDYFKENALILHYSRGGSASYKYRFDCLVKKDNKLHIGLLKWIAGKKEASGGVSAVTITSGLGYVIEVNKIDIQGIDEIEVTKEYQFIDVS